MSFFLGDVHQLGQEADVGQEQGARRSTFASHPPCAVTLPVAACSGLKSKRRRRHQKARNRSHFSQATTAGASEHPSLVAHLHIA